MQLQKSRSYLINDWLCNCRFEARRAPPSAMGFLDYFGASGLMWKRRACPGTQCLIHQLPPAQRRGSIPAPTRGHAPGGPGWAPPSLDSAHCSAHCGHLQRGWHYPPAALGSQRGSFRGLLRGWAGGPCVLRPPLASPSPTPYLHPHTFPWRGHTGSQLGPFALLPVSRNFHLCVRTLLPLVGMLNVSPRGVHLSSRLGLVTPIRISHYLFMCLPPHQPDVWGDCVLLGTLVHRMVLRGHEPPSK